jgi:hypothetical protein
MNSTPYIVEGDHQREMDASDQDYNRTPPQ